MKIKQSDCTNGNLNGIHQENNLHRNSFLNEFGKIMKIAGKSALQFIPGGQIITTALETFGNSSNSEPIGNGMFPYDMLGIQQQLLQESQQYTLISNIIKIRHDAVMNAIRNIR